MTTIEKLNEFGVIPISLPTPLDVGRVNAFLIKQDPPVLIDTGMGTEEGHAAIAAALKQAGLSIADLGAIFITHIHRDHMGLMRRLLDESNAESYAHPFLKEAGMSVDEEERTRKQFYIEIMSQFGVPDDVRAEANSRFNSQRSYSEPIILDHTLEDGETNLALTAYHVPGHSPSDTLLVDQAHRFCFTGDHILGATTPNPHIRHPKPGQPRVKSLIEFQRSLKRTRELDVGICCPGHGKVFEDHVAAIDRILDRQERRSEQVMRLVREGNSTPYQIARTMFPKVPTNSIHRSLSIVVGHIELLEEQGELAPDARNGVVHYRLP